jgi:signal transduction histidine kinase
VGAALVSLMYLYLGQVLDHELTIRSEIGEQPPARIEPGGTDAPRHLSPELHNAVTGELQRARTDTLNTMLVASLVLVGVAGAAAGGLGWFLAGRALRPLREITATARRVADRSLHERIDLAGPHDEVKELADTFDGMLERLERSFNDQRRFVANASHELHTPLTISRTLIEVAFEDPRANDLLRQLGSTLLSVNQRQERLIDGLLTLAISDHRVTEPSPLDLAEIARRVTTESEARARTARVDIVTRLEAAPVAGEPVLLERLVENLIDNAIRYNLPDGGWIAVTTDVVDVQAHLTVENAGPLVPADEAPGLIEPFRRLSTTERLVDSGAPVLSRGAGLGLSIVHAVAQAHGGGVHISPRQDGGLKVRVWIPALSKESRQKVASP